MLLIVQYNHLKTKPKERFIASHVQGFKMIYVNLNRYHTLWSRFRLPLVCHETQEERECLDLNKISLSTDMICETAEIFPRIDHSKPKR